MACNTSVSGGRWRCASCENFLSYQELQLCGLTRSALKKFAGEVSSQRHRVEFRADRTYHLLPPQKLRYANKKRRLSSQGVTNTITAKAVANEEIIELD